MWNISDNAGNVIWRSYLAKAQAVLMLTSVSAVTEYLGSHSIKIPHIFKYSKPSSNCAISEK